MSLQTVGGMRTSRLISANSKTRNCCSNYALSSRHRSFTCRSSSRPLRVAAPSCAGKLRVDMGPLSRLVVAGLSRCYYGRESDSAAAARLSLFTLLCTGPRPRREHLPGRADSDLVTRSSVVTARRYCKRHGPTVMPINLKSGNPSPEPRNARPPEENPVLRVGLGHAGLYLIHVVGRPGLQVSRVAAGCSPRSG
eukprot:CAMPEP_0172184826 /NCGR_PEP_ID=MMETSP1050-20130122/19806_1 /TAXON_ID=233186 /ORGANISM="Cryptomonas curvata, Strain CCAP979/52" /LENGTH=194 /DNA_ID=CAMNT_0012858697 /DNA_START=473 /DNA_END=1054 /DNA_ORIENTATION=+